MFRVISEVFRETPERFRTLSENDPVKELCQGTVS
jgi:hypothetical protein